MVSTSPSSCTFLYVAKATHDSWTESDRQRTGPAIQDDLNLHNGPHDLRGVRASEPGIGAVLAQARSVTVATTAQCRCYASHPQGE